MATEVCRISPQEVKRALDRGERLVVLDVRQAGAYDASDVEIPGARRVAPTDIDSVVPSLPRGVPIVAFCT